jgi:ABC-type multidrug transport system ATPase subunit
MRDLVLRVDRLKVRGLPPLSFSIPEGECLAIQGPSGSGKTLLLRAIADLDPASGHVFLDGAERSEMSAPTWRARVRYVSAEPGWWAETARPQMPESDRSERVLAALGLDSSIIDRSLARVSTGERQRLALARAFASEPQVLLLDEPTAALDPQSAALVEEFLRFQLLSGRSVLLVSHDAAQVDRLAHARLLLGDLRPPETSRGAVA